MRPDLPPHLKGALIIDSHTFTARHLVGREPVELPARTVHVGGEWSPAQHARKP